MASGSVMVGMERLYPARMDNFFTPLVRGGWMKAGELYHPRRAPKAFRQCIRWIQWWDCDGKHQRIRPYDSGDWRLHCYGERKFVPVILSIICIKQYSKKALQRSVGLMMMKIVEGYDVIDISKYWMCHKE